MDRAATPHTISVFDRELEQLDHLVAQMAIEARTQFVAAIAALGTDPRDDAQQVIANDKRLDGLEVEVNNLAIHIIIARQPVANDLRRIIAAIRMAADLERIGDFAKNIAKRVLILRGMSASLPVDGLTRLGELVDQLFAELIDANYEDDADRAEAVWRRDEEVDGLHLEVSTAISREMEREPRLVEPGVQLHFIAKNIERIGDHLTNIAEQIVYHLNGMPPLGDRPKRDPLTGPAIQATA